MIWLTSYFEEFLDKRNHAFLKMALIHVKTELPFINFENNSDEVRNGRCRNYIKDSILRIRKFS